MSVHYIEISKEGVHALSELPLITSENDNLNLFEDEKYSSDYGMSADECIHTYGGDSRSRGWASLKRGGGVKNCLNSASTDRKTSWYDHCRVHLALFQRSCNTPSD